MGAFSSKFGQAIGNVVLESPTVLAPMRGVTTTAYRRLCREHGAALTFSEGVGSVYLLEAIRNGTGGRYLNRVQSERPLGIQLGAAEPELVAEAARHAIAHGFDIVDLNFGMPPRPGLAEGSALLRDPSRIGRIVRAVVAAAATVPVTVKIRAGTDPEHRNAVEVARVAEAEGASAVTVHGRTGTQGYLKRSDWTIIRDVKEAVAIPVIGNGDVLTPEDAAALIARTGCDFVMVGRGTYGNPWLFSRTNEYLRSGRLPPEPTLGARLRSYARYLELVYDSGDWPRGAADAGYRYATVARRWKRGEWGERASVLEQVLWGRILLRARRLKAKRVSARLR